MTDPITCAIDRHLDGIDAYEARLQARLQAEGHICNRCGERAWWLNGDDLCEWCVEELE